MTTSSPMAAPGVAKVGPSRRLVLLVPALMALVAGAMGGLVRLGWPGVPAPVDAVAFHGGLLMAGFFGTLISLERAVALGKYWSYAAPIASGAGALTLLAGLPWTIGAGLGVAGAAVFVAAGMAVIVRQRANFTIILLLGAASLLIGNVLWLSGRPVFELVPWWICFLVLTIAGERLELTRMVPVPAARRRLFDIILLLIPAAGVVSFFAPDLGLRLLGALFLATAIWLMRHDTARRTIRMVGLPRYIAWCLFAGYVWLAISGAIFLHGGLLTPGFAYDAALHAIFLGFAFSMVFGHAPVIFPAVVRLPVEYRPSAYVHLIVLHASLVVRAGADAAGWFELRRWAGMGNAVALLLFFGSIVISVLRARRRTSSSAAHSAGPPVAKACLPSNA